MKKLLSCALGASIGLISAVRADDPVPAPASGPATPALPSLPSLPPSLAPNAPATPAPAALPAPDVVPNPAPVANVPAPPPVVTGPMAQAASSVPVAPGQASRQMPTEGPLLDCWRVHYDRPAQNGFAAESLIWWIRSASTPPLLEVTAPSTNPYRPNGPVIIGGNDLDEQQHYGARLSYIHWFDREATTGFDANVIITDSRRAERSFTSLDFANLSRPFNSVNPGLEGKLADPVLIGGAIVGGIGADINTDFYGTELNLRTRLNLTCRSRTDLIYGFRYLGFNETLTILEQQRLIENSSIVPAETAGTRAIVFDRFAVENNFFGGQIGWNTDYALCEKWEFNLRSMFAFGTTRQRSNIQGQTNVFYTNGGTQQYVGGVLALDSNIGDRVREVFSFVPQVTGQVSYRPCRGLKLFCGYDFLYWTNVLRAGNQVDMNIDATRIPRFAPAGAVNPADFVAPVAAFKNSDFWAQGLSVGAEVRW